MLFSFALLGLLLGCPVWSHAQSYAASKTPSTLLSPRSDAQQRWGAQDANQHWAIAPLYDTLYALPYTRFETQTHQVHHTPSGYWMGERDGQQWVLHASGRVLLKAETILPRLMGRFVLIKQGPYWGLRTISGSAVLPTRCTQIQWHGDVLALQHQGQWHLLDAQEGHRYPQTVDEVRLAPASPRHQLLLVRRGQQWGVLNERLVQVLPFAYQALELAPHTTPIEHLTQVQFIAQTADGRGLLTLNGDWTPLDK